MHEKQLIAISHSSGVIFLTENFTEVQLTVHSGEKIPLKIKMLILPSVCQPTRFSVSENRIQHS